MSTNDLKEKLIPNTILRNNTGQHQNYKCDEIESNNTEDLAQYDNEKHSYQKPLDLFMVCTNQDNQNGQLEPLNVYTPQVKPVLGYKQSDCQPYYHYFDEQSYLNQGNLQKIKQEDGLLGYYSSMRNENVLQMMVCVTMYSEDRHFLEQTLLHIQNNIPSFNKLGVQDFQLCVVVIQDGIMKMREDVVDFYTQLEGDDFDPHRNLKIRRHTIQQQINFLDYSKQSYLLDANDGLPPSIPKQVALVYQNRIQLTRANEKDKNSAVRVCSSQSAQFNPNLPSLTLFTVFKHKNAKKLSSHLWFFEGFCRQLRPKYCAFVDVGTLPKKEGLVKFYKAMEGNNEIGGVCGFLGLEEPPEGEEIDEKSKNKQLSRVVDEFLEKKKQSEYLEWEKKYEDQIQNKQSKINNDKMKDCTNEDIKMLKNQLDNSFRSKAASQHYLKKYIQSNIILWILFFPFYIVKYVILESLWKILKFFMWCLSKFLENYLRIFSSLRLAQVYEYAIGHMVDKNFDSLLGFLHVLPGAWSAYRYEALELKNDQNENFLQKSYFKSIMNPELLTNDIKEANKFLAEDRILCLGIISQQESKYKLKYIPDAYAVTDSPESLEEFINQRRRWTNSMVYALKHVLKNYKHDISESLHSRFFRRLKLPINMLFARIGLFNTYFIPAFYLFVVIVSGYQFQIPHLKYGKQFVPTNQLENNNHCILDYELKDNEKVCSSSDNIYSDCYKECSQENNSRPFNIFMTVFPFTVIITLIMFIMVSLTFKMKKQNPQDYIKLYKMVLSREQEEEINSCKQRLQSENKSKKQIEQQINSLIKKHGEEKLKQLKVLFESKKTHLLPAHLQKIKSDYDKLNTQFENNKIFKIFAALISIESTILMLIITSAVIINIFSHNTFEEFGFSQGPDWLRYYIIIMLALNTGLFLLTQIIHLFFQPQLVWLIFKSFLSYFFYSPVYLLFLTIFSFCNIDDVTWGTKGLQSEEQNKIFVQDKVRFVTKWLLWNSALLLAFVMGALIPKLELPYVIIVIGFYGTLYYFIRTTASAINYIKYYTADKLNYHLKFKKIKEENFKNSDHLRQQFYSTIYSQNNQSIGQMQGRYSQMLISSSQLKQEQSFFSYPNKNSNLPSNLE